MVISITSSNQTLFSDVRNIYQDKASTDMTLDEFKLLTSTCWNKNINLLQLI